MSFSRLALPCLITLVLVLAISFFCLCNIKENRKKIYYTEAPEFIQCFIQWYMPNAAGSGWRMGCPCKIHGRLYQMLCVCENLLSFQKHNRGKNYKFFFTSEMSALLIYLINLAMTPIPQFSSSQKRVLMALSRLAVTIWFWFLAVAHPGVSAGRQLLCLLTQWMAHSWRAGATLVCFDRALHMRLHN